MKIKHFCKAKEAYLSEEAYNSIGENILPTVHLESISLQNIQGTKTNKKLNTKKTIHLKMGYGLKRMLQIKKCS